MLVVIFANVWC